MKNKFIVAALFIFGLGCTAVSAQTTKIGYVDSRAVSDKLPEVKQAYAQLGEFQKVKENDLRKDAEDLQKRIEQYQKDAPTMAEPMRNATEKELGALQEKMEIKRTNAQADIENRQKQVFDPIEKRIQEAIKTVATENGYTYVFAREVLLHYPASDDISELVTKKLLANAPKIDNSTPKPAGSTTNPNQQQTGNNTTTPPVTPKKK